ncbi:MAG: topoisomerase C-terminal repeat-containing protein, partial [Bacilli bacterium]
KYKEKGRPKKPTETLGKCVRCDGEMVDKGNFFGCTHFHTSNCRFTLPKVYMGKKLSAKMISSLLTKGRTGVLKGFMNQKGTDALNGHLELRNGAVCLVPSEK